MNYILFDHELTWQNLLPLTFTRPISEVRIGITTIKEKWDAFLNTNCTYYSRPYLRGKYACDLANENVLLNSAVIPDADLVNAITQLQNGEALVREGRVLAARVLKDELSKGLQKDAYKTVLYEQNCVSVQYPWDIFAKNGDVMQMDFERITQNRTSEPISGTNRLLGADNIFVEPGAKVECAIINATTGPVYIGENAEIMEGSVVRGPFAMCTHSALKMSAKIYGPTTLGPHVKVGGEINNSVIFGYSNKAHDGFLGNSVVGEWCNLGADTNNSNLKNNYAEVRVWNYPTERFVKTGRQFCGLIMGDHSKSAINTMFNTGTVVGVNANIFGAGFPRNFVPSFSWGGAHGMEVYAIKNAYKVNETVMKRRGIPLTDEDKAILGEVFEQTQKYRRF